MTSLRNLLRAIFRHDAMNTQMNDEMRAHLVQATDRLVARGMSPAEAARAARREFGNPAVLAEDGRDARGASWVETVRGDLRYGIRSLRASPAFTAVAVLSLAIGIGANTAIFSLINAVMLKPLPVVRPAELIQVGMGDSTNVAAGSIGNTYLTNPLWEAIRDQTGDHATYAVSDYTGFSLVSGGEIRSARGMWINGDFFRTLGITPMLGRLIENADDRPGCAATVVLGEAFWRSEFGGSANVLGRTMLLEGKMFTIIGVVPASFFGIDVGTVQQLYVPLCAEPIIRGESSALPRRSNWWLRVLARPRAGVTATELAERLRIQSRPIMEASLPDGWPADRKAGFLKSRLLTRPAVHGLSEVRSRYATALKILMGMVGLILLIACANVANLSLARGAARSRELAVRIALGASRGRVIRQLLTEAGLIAVAGTVAGIGIATWATRFLVAMLGTSRGKVLLDLSPDLNVLAFTAGACIATVLLFALIPAVRATRVDPQVAMKTGGRGTAEGQNRFRVGKALVVAQSALAFVLVVGAGLLVTSFTRLNAAPLGFDPEGVLITRVRHGGSTPPDQRRAVLERMRAQIALVPGVQSVSSVDISPISGSSWNDDVVLDGDPVTARTPALVWFNAAGPDYFRTMRTRLLAGRDFGVQDAPTSARVAIINRTGAKKLFKGESPIGRSFRVRFQGKDGERTTIVGMVEDSPYESLRAEANPLIFLSRDQENPGGSSQFVIRAGTSIPAVVGSIKSISQAIDPEMLLLFTRLEDQLSESLQRERALATLSGFFAGLALALAMIGLYGVMAYTVARRRVEIGIRVALGAARGRVLRLVLGDVGLLVGGGILIGTAAALAGVRVLGSLLYGIEARDPWNIAGAALVLGIGALVAGAIPARRAAALQPTEALRED
jgi:putative ABC transport system permease protein